jgi:hypothetical protein
MYCDGFKVFYAIPYHTIPYHTKPYHTLYTIPYHILKILCLQRQLFQHKHTGGLNDSVNDPAMTRLTRDANDKPRTNLDVNSSRDGTRRYQISLSKSCFKTIAKIQGLGTDKSLSFPTKQSSGSAATQKIHLRSSSYPCRVDQSCGGLIPAWIMFDPVRETHRCGQRADAGCWLRSTKAVPVRLAQMRARYQHLHVKLNSNHASIRVLSVNLRELFLVKDGNNSHLSA